MSTEPRESPRSTYCVPFWSPVTAGGVSRPVKSVCVSCPWPASTPMYAPDSSVPSPDTPVAPTRGRTIQKREPLTAKSSASFFSCTWTSTRDRSFDSLIVLTMPISTSLYFTCVLPGSSPSALWKLIEISGPRSRTDLITRPIPISAAISGTSQTSDGSQPLFVEIAGSGGRDASCCGPCGLFMVFP
jgi:hypothetical protein